MDSNVLQYLKDNFYIVHSNDEWIISNKFIRDIGARAPDAKSSNSKQPVRNTNSSVDTSKEAYKQFIEDAAIPTMISNGYGKSFYANRYSVFGHKAWKSAIEEHGEKLLLAATKYYYKQTTVARVMVGNFFGEGIYESFVDDVKNALAKRKPLINSEESSSNMERG